MKKKKPFIQLFLIAGLLFAAVTACEKTYDPGGDFPSAGTVKDADGNKYNTVKIGSQVWTVENLKTTKYKDGTKIINVTSDTQWASLTTGAYCNYNNLESNVATYGRLYNFYAVNTGKLAPTGWHVATDNDWTILESYLIAYKLFNPFRTTSVKSTGNEKSTGLGLAIAKKIVEAHHVKISVESQVGTGSVFSYTLPKLM